MKRRTFLGALGGVGVLGGGYVAFDLFAPEQATRSDESISDDGVSVLQRGEFVGKDGHRCSGTVELAQDSEGHLLRFREYEQTQGPDVFCYLTPAEDPDTESEVGAGRKVLIDGGADGGEMTRTGTFTQRLPDDVTVDDKRGVAVWCDDFAVPFGAATLEPV